MKYTKFELKLEKTLVKEHAVDFKIDNCKDVHLFGIQIMELHKQAQEIFAIMMLDTKLKVIGWAEISRGSLDGTVIHPREVFKPAILANARAIIAFHNHPSGNPKPSQDDIDITNRLRESGDLLGVPLLDHVIIGDGERYSFKEHDRI